MLNHYTLDTRAERIFSIQDVTLSNSRRATYQQLLDLALSLFLQEPRPSVSLAGVWSHVGDTQPTVLTPLQSLLYEPTCCSIWCCRALPEGICKFSVSVTLAFPLTLSLIVSLNFWCSEGYHTYFDDVFSAWLSSISLQLTDWFSGFCLLSWDQLLHLHTSLFFLSES